MRNTLGATQVVALPKSLFRKGAMLLLADLLAQPAAFKASWLEGQGGR
jgi:hypothetical protein